MVLKKVLCFGLYRINYTARRRRRRCHFISYELDTPSVLLYTTTTIHNIVQTPPHSMPVVSINRPLVVHKKIHTHTHDLNVSIFFNNFNFIDYVWSCACGCLKNDQLNLIAPTSSSTSAVNEEIALCALE